MKNIQSFRGFTLVELPVVIAIIAYWRDFYCPPYKLLEKQFAECNAATIQSSSA